MQHRGRAKAVDVYSRGGEPTWVSITLRRCDLCSASTWSSSLSYPTANSSKLNPPFALTSLAFIISSTHACRDKSIRNEIHQ